MRNQTLFSELNNSVTVLRAIIFLFAMGFSLTLGVAQTVVTIPPAKTTVEVGRSECKKYSKPVNANVRITVGNPAIAKASFNPTTEEFCVEGVSEGMTRVTFAGTFRQAANNNNGGMAGGVSQNDEQFTFDLAVKVGAKVENTETNVPGLQSERGKNVRIFYTSLREYDAQKAAQLLQERGYVPDKELAEDGEATQSQKRKLYCVLSSGGTEAGVRGIAELIKNIESVKTECLEDKPHTDPEYVLWIVSEQPFIAELKDYKNEIGEATKIFDDRFHYDNIEATFVKAFDEEGTGDWDGNAAAWSRRGFWLSYVEGYDSVRYVIYDRPLGILSQSVKNIEQWKKPYTPDDVAYIRDRMTYWRQRKEQLAPLLNEILKVYSIQNRDYKERDLKEISGEEFTNRLAQRRSQHKTLGEEIKSLIQERVFIRTIGEKP